MATETAVHNGPSRIERLSADDFETASIRSAAPSYTSEAPSYHSTLPPNEPCPIYTPPTGPQAPSSSSTPTPRQSRSMLPPTPVASNFAPGAGLPRLPSPRRRSELPRLSQFSMPAWSSSSTANPTARHYQSVASRRVAAATSTPRPGVENALRTAMDRVSMANANADPDEGRVRPLEDPYLVGEVAAARAKRERLARQNGDDVLIMEDRRWDWFLGKLIFPCFLENFVILQLLSLKCATVTSGIGAGPTSGERSRIVAVAGCRAVLGDEDPQADVSARDKAGI
ncbi:hypothetical protein F5Y15DRAFT_412383 [Xylariaceae sp. FL0016]|nr:hypothetical protein F5Y15DRAFT_412383 [Xylariaceae sp. FL0016]